MQRNHRLPKRPIIVDRLSHHRGQLVTIRFHHQRPRRQRPRQRIPTRVENDRNPRLPGSPATIEIKILAHALSQRAGQNHHPTPRQMRLHLGEHLRRLIGRKRTRFLHQFRRRAGRAIDDGHAGPRGGFRFNAIVRNPQGIEIPADKSPGVASDRNAQHRFLAQNTKHAGNIHRLARRAPPGFHRPIHLIRRHALEDHRLLNRRRRAQAKVHEGMMNANLTVNKP